MDKVIEAFLFAIGGYTALGIWFPRFRGNWKGTRITIGAVSSAGFASFFISIGLILMWGDKVPQRNRAWLVLPIIPAFLLITIGYVLDTRAYARMSGTPAEPLVSPQRRWLVIVFGIILIVLLVQMIFKWI